MTGGGGWRGQGSTPLALPPAAHCSPLGSTASPGLQHPRRQHDQLAALPRGAPRRRGRGGGRDRSAVTTSAPPSPSPPPPPPRTPRGGPAAGPRTRSRGGAGGAGTALASRGHLRGAPIRTWHSPRTPGLGTEHHLGRLGGRWRGTLHRLPLRQPPGTPGTGRPSRLPPLLEAPHRVSGLLAARCPAGGREPSTPIPPLGRASPMGSQCATTHPCGQRQGGATRVRGTLTPPTAHPSHPRHLGPSPGWRSPLSPARGAALRTPPAFEGLRERVGRRGQGFHRGSAPPIPLASTPRLPMGGGPRTAHAPASTGLPGHTPAAQRGAPGRGGGQAGAGRRRPLVPTAHLAPTPLHGTPLAQPGGPRGHPHRTASTWSGGARGRGGPRV